MKTNTDDIDQMIEEALTREEATYLKDMEEESLPEMLVGLYRGKQAWMAYLTGVIILIVTVFTFYSGFKVYNAVETLEAIQWTAALVVGTIMISILKIWNWMQMDKNSMVKHIKHLEYQISVLVSKIKDK